MKQPEKMIIYNLFPLLTGKFTDWEKHLIRASDMGFNWIFVNPIQYPGFSGSLYSIKDYFSFNDLLIDSESDKSPEEQLKEANEAAKQLIESRSGVAIGEEKTEGARRLESEREARRGFATNRAMFTQSES